MKINVPFSKEEAGALINTADLAIKAGGLMNARILVPLCDRIATAVATEEAKITAAQPTPTNDGGDSTQP
jgi:hypothetical protein